MKINKDWPLTNDNQYISILENLQIEACSISACFAQISAYETTEINPSPENWFYAYQEGLTKVGWHINKSIRQAIINESDREITLSKLLMTRTPDIKGMEWKSHVEFDWVPGDTASFVGVIMIKLNEECVKMSYFIADLEFKNWVQVSDKIKMEVIKNAKMGISAVLSGGWDI